MQEAEAQDCRIGVRVKTPLLNSFYSDPNYFQPAFCDLAVGPHHCLILVYADHDVIVVAHDRVGTQINGEYGTK